MEEGTQRQKALRELYDFVAEQVLAGLYKSDIVEKLIELGIDRHSADTLVDEMQERLERVSRRTIVLVVPDAGRRGRLEDGLMAAGYTVFSAGRLEEGLDAVRRAVPDLVVIDGRAAQEQAFQLVKKLRRRPVGRRIPVLVLGVRRQQSEAFAAFGKVECVGRATGTDALVARIKKIVYYKRV